ncbi:hypothetical protein ESY86_07585 [Subsaximicrobium wynnwilliamsii]|uniref:Uncharacterized protein n=1 Tax=Subsaximicrobium wynnwilliamsii TaxID=291179 RepID=A0A5C6ZJ98_9FLAO|nr:hypothetical protein [Subsaximicrobium wynnwilliamsii]TXD83899.1 hypothetical protein ESY87_07750 [Subsaximicrobium wynnwilliamsii]TXD89639.1 hypothetical protein ESY86_07585 [Subsaximicrobium wynnwilliamsii]TXE02569.1 hypothetical protein ESY88_11255 [Subsaximicrobium wynnwilliamsii]
MAAVLLVCSSLNANAVVKQDAGCFEGADLAASALGGLYGYSYYQEYLLFNALYDNCESNGGWD